MAEMRQAKVGALGDPNFDGIAWLVNGGDWPADWEIDAALWLGASPVDFFRQRVIWGPGTAPPPYTWQRLWAFPSPLEVDQVVIQAIDHRPGSPPFWLFFYRPPGLVGGQPTPGQSPARPDVNLVGQVFISQSGIYQVALSTLPPAPPTPPSPTPTPAPLPQTPLGQLTALAASLAAVGMVASLATALTRAKR